jgi:hypothetical protein
MIRYALAVVLTTAVLAIGMAGVEHAATVRSEQQVETQIAKIETAAVSLAEHDDTPPQGQPGPRRVVELDLPQNGVLSTAVGPLTIEPDRAAASDGEEAIVANGSTAMFQFDGRARHALTIDVRVRAPRGESETPAVDLSGERGTKTVILELRADDHGQYVVVIT